MDSSNIKQLNRDIVEGFLSKQAFTQETSIFLEDLKLNCPLKIQMYLIEEFIRMNVIKVLPDGKMYFKQRRWKMTTRLFNAGYLILFLLPVIIGLAFIIF